ncbi:glycosyltransferase [Gammaproteobacteria bacterium]|nr:glycosyltransferase [Gammaproteobacteria bacterium]
MNTKDRKTILHIITNLGPGGAPKYLLKLIQNDENNSHLIYVIDKKDSIAQNDKIKFKIIYSRFNKLLFPFPHILELIYCLIKIRPVIIQSWLYHADFLTIFLRPIFRKNIIWSIRNSIYDISILKKTTILILKICSLFSKLVPNKILYNSQAGRLSHEIFGYNSDKGEVIVNGISIPNDLPTYKKSSGIFRIGTACRNDPAKGLENMLLALDDLNFNDWSWTLIGDGCTNLNIINNNDKIFLHEFSNDINHFYSNIDLFVLPSLSEGLSNVLLEAMSRRVTCLATDVGDNKLVLADNTKIVSPGNHNELTKKINECFALFKKDIVKYQNNNKIDHIKSEYSYKKSVKAYQDQWKNLT